MRAVEKRETFFLLEFKRRESVTLRDPRGRLDGATVWSWALAAALSIMPTFAFTKQHARFVPEGPAIARTAARAASRNCWVDPPVEWYGCATRCF